MKPAKTMKFAKIEEEEAMKQRKKYEDSLKNKKNQLKSQFEHLEEIRRYEELSVQSSNDIKFKNELNHILKLKESRIKRLD